MSRLLLAAVAATLALPTLAHAKAERTVKYEFAKVWPTAVRHLRVEEGHAIVDKDSETGYVMFTVKDEGKEFKGALELIRGKDTEGKPTVKLVLRIEDRPTYMESGILTRMVQKLEKERRDDPPPPPKDDASGA